MLVLVDEMTKQRSLGYAERAFMGEEGDESIESDATSRIAT
jgi:hypothetical protein